MERNPMQNMTTGLRVELALTLSDELRRLFTPITVTDGDRRLFSKLLPTSNNLAPFRASQISKYLTKISAVIDGLILIQ